MPSRRIRAPSAVPRPDRELRRQVRMQHGFEALDLMRDRGWTLRRAAREVNEDPRSMLGVIKSALRKDRSGRYRPLARDRLVRPLQMLTADKGWVPVEVVGSEKASLLGSYANAINDAAEARPSAIGQFRGKSIRISGRTYPFITDRRTLERIGKRGQLGFEGFYRFTT